MNDLLQDLRYGLRLLRTTPGFSIMAVLALALGIGANTSIFSLINTVLLRSLPYKDPQQLVIAWQYDLQRGVDDGLFSFPKFTDLKDQTQVFESVSAYINNVNFNLSGIGEPEQIQATRVSSDFFQTLGVMPTLGRTFLAEEDALGGNQIAMISHRLWARRYGSDPGMLGKAIGLDGQSVTIIGILPADFDYPNERVDVWLPRAFESSTRTAEQVRIGATFLNVIARLKPDAELSKAQDDIALINMRYREQYPNNLDADSDLGVALLQDRQTRKIRLALYILLGAVGFVLLIACANVANLLLARAATRHKEVAVRCAMGATRSRLIRQFLTESLLLSVVGGGLGLIVAGWGINFWLATSSNNIPGVQKIGLDSRVLIFTTAVSILTGIVFGLAPALHSSKIELSESLKEGGRGTSDGFRRKRIQNLLIISEIALAMLLSIGAGLMIQSFLRLQEIGLGFNPQKVLTMQMALPNVKYSDKQKQVAFYDTALQRVAGEPGVKSAGMVSSLPLRRDGIRYLFNVDGKPSLGPGKDPLVFVRVTSPDYFKTMGMQMIQGRPLMESDGMDSPKVAVINETIARRYWPDENPIGKRLAYSRDKIECEVVGVVGDIRFEGLDIPPTEEMYVPYRQRPWLSMTLVVTSSQNATAMVSTIRNIVLGIDQDQPVANIRTMEQIISESVAQPRLITILLGSFAAVAMLLALIGIYGVTSYSVTQRRGEIGIRVALGAQSADILKLVIREAMTRAVIGILIGIVAAIILSRVMKSILFEVSATDPFTFAITALALAVVALIACYVPARRAAHVDPIIALRCS